jgi:alpha-amylase
MGVILQVFYWNCPQLENQEFEWWNFLQGKVASLSEVGFTALWLPPISKAGAQKSMGYDPFDYYDLGDFDQKGGVKTWFGNEAELRSLVTAAHQHKIDVYVDMVMNHNNGGEPELNQLDNVTRNTKFDTASGKFARNWECFHPCKYETMDESAFGDMPDLCHRNPYVYTGFLEYAQWLLEDIGMDGFRFDFVKGYGAWMVRAIQEMRGLKGNTEFNPFGVGECWDSDRNIYDWLAEVNTWSDNPINAFDFPLRYRLKDLCMTYGFSLKTLTENGTLLTDGLADTAVTFVENHDVIRGDAIINDKMLAYSFILTHEGYPCVFWQDYFNWNLARENTPNGIAALIKVHEQYAGGETTVLYVDDNLYIIQREGIDNQPGLIYVLNNTGQWNGSRVKTKWINKNFSAAAWWSNGDMAMPQPKQTNAYGFSDFWAAPRGYAVYVPV